MAEEENEDKKEPAPVPKKSKLPIIIGAVVAVLLIAGAVGFFMMKGKKPEKEDIDPNAVSAASDMSSESDFDEEDQYGEEEEPLGAIFPLDTFVVNLSGGRFVRIQMQVEFTTRDVPKRFMPRLPIIRDGVISSINQLSAEKVLAENGKDNIKKQVKEVINTALAKEEVKKIYFTQFIVQ